MTTATIDLYEIVQNIQTGDRMVSRALFNVTVGTASYPACSCEISQPVGTGYNDAPFEAGAPSGYPDDAPWNVTEFGDKLEAIYRRRIMNAPGGLRGVVMRNNRFGLKEQFTIELPE